MAGAGAGAAWSAGMTPAMDTTTEQRSISITSSSDGSDGSDSDFAALYHSSSGSSGGGRPDEKPRNTAATTTTTANATTAKPSNATAATAKPSNANRTTPTTPQRSTRSATLHPHLYSPGAHSPPRVGAVGELGAIGSPLGGPLSPWSPPAVSPSRELLARPGVGKFLWVKDEVDSRRVQLQQEQESLTHSLPPGGFPGAPGVNGPTDEEDPSESQRSQMISSKGGSSTRSFIL